jgi:hypothetical protein
MSAKKKQSIVSGYLIIPLSIIILLSIFFLLKLLIVKEKWMKISGVELIDIQKHKTSSHWDATGSLIVNSNDFTSDKKLVDSAALYYDLYRLEFNLDESKNVIRWRIGLSYPEGFIIKTDDKIVCASPNVYYSSKKDKYIIVCNHPDEVSSSPEYFYINNTQLKKGKNIFELSFLVLSSEARESLPEIHIDVLKKGYFISSFEKIRINDENICSYTELPELHITTSGKKIKDDPKINASLTVKSLDTVFSSNIKIEKRGHSSQDHGVATFNYSFNTYDGIWKKKNLGLLELPEESSWVLYTPSMDKSLLRNALTYSLYSKTGNYSPRFEFCNLFIDDLYVGLYLLIEKPKLDKNRINYYTSNKKDVFLCSIDYAKENKFGWDSERDGRRIRVNVLSPDIEDFNDIKKEYITNYFELVDNEFNKLQLDYPLLDSLIDTDTFIEYILFHELGKNLDSYRLSSYFSKAPQQALKFGPIWDFDLAYGNALLGKFSETDGWCFESDKEVSSPIIMLNWAEIMLTNKVYQKNIKQKWNLYRNTILSDSSITNCIDSLNLIIRDDIPYHFKAIDYLNKWCWPNTYVGGSHNNEVFHLKSWVLSRAYWMDEEIEKF